MVIDVTNFHPKTNYRGSPRHLAPIERYRVPVSIECNTGDHRRSADVRTPVAAGSLAPQKDLYDYAVTRKSGLEKICERGAIRGSSRTARSLRDVSRIGRFARDGGLPEFHRLAG